MEWHLGPQRQYVEGYPRRADIPEADAPASTPLEVNVAIPRSDADWHRHVRKAAVELREARLRASAAAVPASTLANVFEAELALADTKGKRVA